MKHPFYLICPFNLFQVDQPGQISGHHQLCIVSALVTCSVLMESMDTTADSNSYETAFGQTEQFGLLFICFEIWEVPLCGIGRRRQLLMWS